MFQPPVLAPLTPGQIGGVSTAFNTSTENLLSGLLALRADIALQNIAAFGAGRFASSVAGSEGAAPVAGARAGSGLTIQLPRATWLVDGHMVNINDLSGYVETDDDGFISLDDAPSGADSWGYLSLIFDEETGYALEVEWLAAPDADKRRGGKPCIGKVTTDEDEVTAIDATAADVIWSQALLQSKIAALVVGGGGGEGGPVFGSSIPITPDDPTTIKAFYDAKIADAIASLRAIIGNSGDAFPDDLTSLADNLAVTMAGLMEVNPHAIERAQMAIVVKQSGHGQDDTPDFTPDTGAPNELPWNPATGEFGPL